MRWRGLGTLTSQSSWWRMVNVFLLMDIFILYSKFKRS
jgi:hypothetical protein